MDYLHYSKSGKPIAIYSYNSRINNTIPISKEEIEIIKTSNVEVNNNSIQIIPPISSSSKQKKLEASIRNTRDNLLRDSDWTQLADIPEELKNKYKEYRQLLRNIPQQVGFPKGVVWPVI